MNIDTVIAIVCGCLIILPIAIFGLNLFTVIPTLLGVWMFFQ